MQLTATNKRTYKVYRYFLAVLAGVTLFSNNASASDCDPATVTMISTLPYQISSPGVYCLANSMTFLSTSNSSISAITVAASDVELNLNNNALKGRWARVGSTVGKESGITVTGYVSNVWIHNGSIVGLLNGVVQSTNTGSTTASNLLVEDMNFVDIRNHGISYYGTSCDNCTIRNNAFYNMDSALCTTDCSVAYAYGMEVRNLSNSTITGNKIIGLHTYGDQVPAYAMYINTSTNVTVSDNSIVDEPFSLTSNVGIVAVSSTDINMSGNVFSNIYKGIWYFYSTGAYSNTKYVNTQIPYTGGTDGGGNQ